MLMPDEPPSESDDRFLIYRKGGVNPGNLTPRAKDAGRLSFWDSLTAQTSDCEPAFPPGAEWFAIDVRRLPASAIEYDNVPPGHVSLDGLPPNVVKDAVVKKGRIPQ
jgi:hypothetical protein